MENRALGLMRRNGLWLLGCVGMLCLAWLLLPAGQGEWAGIETTAGAALPLSGRIIAVDAGHGGYDGGARAPNGTWEKVYNLSVAEKLRDALIAQGAQVIMTRDGDYALCDKDPPMRKKRQDMERRAEKIVGGNAEMVLSIHMNEYRSAKSSGPQVFFRKDCPAGQQLAGVLQAALVTGLSPPKTRDINTGDFYITSLGVPSVLIECGFLSNAAEEALLRSPAYQQKIADALTDGVIAWFALETRAEPAPREER